MAAEPSCAEVRREISNYVDDAVNPSLRWQMDQHFNECSACKSLLDGMRSANPYYVEGHDTPETRHICQGPEN